jgi:hypothetical protein
MEKQKEYNLSYLLAKVRTTQGKASDRLRQRANKRNKNRVGRLPKSEQNWKIVLSDEVRQDRKRLKAAKNLEILNSFIKRFSTETKFHII